MDLPKLADSDVSGKRVLLRLDLDTKPSSDDLRVKASEETLDYLKEKNSEIIILAHRGRPEGVQDNSLSLSSMTNVLSKAFNTVVNFIPSVDEAQKTIQQFNNSAIFLLENLRFDPGEEKNDPQFAKKLATLGDVYVNEAFASSHREHASIVTLPGEFKSKNSVALGFRFIKEVENLTKILDNPKRPVVVIISGAKEDKVEMAKELSEKFDTVLVGGKLPVYFRDTRYLPADATHQALQAGIRDTKLVIGDLIADGEDITLNTITKFKKEIAKAGTIVLAGVLGVYEDEGHRQGTKKIFEAVANSSAFKVAGGGDTETALTMFGLINKFDWISVGGGAMLTFLTEGTLPGIKALVQV